MGLPSLHGLEEVLVVFEWYLNPNTFIVIQQTPGSLLTAWFRGFLVSQRYTSGIKRRKEGGLGAVDRGCRSE